jgi:hypothetical protein
MMKNKLIILSVLLLIGIGFSSCEKYVDETQNWGSISASSVYEDVVLMELVVNGWQNTIIIAGELRSSYADENPPSGGLNAYFRGEIGGDQNSRWNWPIDRDRYNKFWEVNRSINDFLANIDAAPAEMPQSKRDEMKGQAYFWRGVLNHKMVQQFGGIPIITEAQDVTGDPEALNLPRNTTLECFNFIVTQFDLAAGLLPFRGTNGYAEGRPDKMSALAHKVKSLVLKAEPRFNNTKVTGFWQDAYDAATAAKATADANGFGLFPSNVEMWLDYGSRDTEWLFYGKRQAPEVKAYNARPNSAGNGRSFSPCWQLIQRYPMANGMNTDEAGSGYDPDMWWANRDPRFYENIQVHGQEWSFQDYPNNYTWYFEGAGSDANNNYAAENRKTTNTNQTIDDYWLNTSYDWVHIRYTELLLWQAEGANETGNPSVALDNIKLIRERAGIDAGAGNYGLKAGVGSDYQVTYDAIRKAREIELIFEDGQNYWDKLDKNNLKHFRDYVIFERNMPTLNIAGFNALALVDDEGVVVTSSDPTDGGEWTKIREALNLAMSTLSADDKNILIQVVTDWEVRPTDPDNTIGIKDHYVFGAFWQDWINKSPALEQTIGWETGTFDPRITQ